MCVPRLATQGCIYTTPFSYFVQAAPENIPEAPLAHRRSPGCSPAAWGELTDNVADPLRASPLQLRHHASLKGQRCYPEEELPDVLPCKERMQSGEAGAL